MVVHASERQPEGWVTADGARLTWRTLISGDRDPTRGLTAGITEIPATSLPVALHRHAPDELYFFVSGVGTVTIDGVEHPVRDGTTVFVPGNRWHGVHNPGPELLRLFYAFAVDSFTDVEYEYPPGTPPPRWD